MTKNRRRMIFLTLILTCIATSFLSTALSTALPAIIEEQGISAATAQWLTSGYTLIMAIVTPLTAFLLTRFKNKNVFVVSLLVLAAGLILDFFSVNFTMLMTGRVLQAVSTGINLALTQVVILKIYPKEEQGKAMGMYGLALSAAPVVAPSIAGIFIDTVGWRFIFIIALVITAICFFGAIIFMDNVLETEKTKFDVLSFALSIGFFGGITLGIGNISSGIEQLTTWLPLAVGVVTGIIFVMRQLKITAPFLEFRVFHNRIFTISVIMSMLLYLVMMGATIMTPLFIQTVQGRTATISGLVVLPGALATAIVSPLAGRLYDKYGIFKLSIMGTLCLIAASIGMSFLSLATPVWVTTILQAVRSIGIGILMMPFVTWGVSNLESSEMVHGNAILSTFRSVAGSIGTALFVGIAQTIGESSTLLHGMNIAFIIMAVISVLMIVLELFFVNRRVKTAS